MSRSLLVVGGVLVLGQPAWANFRLGTIPCRVQGVEAQLVGVNPTLVVARPRDAVRIVTTAGKDVPFRIANDVAALDSYRGHPDPVRLVIDAPDGTVFTVQHFRAELQRWCIYGTAYNYEVDAALANQDLAIRVRRARRVEHRLTFSPGDHLTRFEIDFDPPPAAIAVRREWAPSYAHLLDGRGFQSVGASRSLSVFAGWKARGAHVTGDLEQSATSFYVRFTPLFPDGTEGVAWTGVVHVPAQPRPLPASPAWDRGIELRTESLARSQPAPRYRIGPAATATPAGPSTDP